MKILIFFVMFPEFQHSIPTRRSLVKTKAFCEITVNGRNIYIDLEYTMKLYSIWNKTEFINI